MDRLTALLTTQAGALDKHTETRIQYSIFIFHFRNLFFSCCSYHKVRSTTLSSTTLINAPVQYLFLFCVSPRKQHTHRHTSTDRVFFIKYRISSSRTDGDKRQAMLFTPFFTTNPHSKQRTLCPGVSIAIKLFACCLSRPPK